MMIIQARQLTGAACAVARYTVTPAAPAAEQGHSASSKEDNVKKLLVILGLFSFLVGSVARGQDKAGHAGDTDHVVVRPDAIKWGPAPPGLPPDSQMGVLVGDPSKPGVPYVVRAKLPDGCKVPPHWHPSDENVTVLRGTFLVGKGEKLDPSKMEELPAGSFMRMPKTMRHFAMAKGETIIQLHGIGPFEINYVNPADDPRKKGDKK
jgi:quercetin dioxygenase-like cupin family protein